MYGLPLKSTSQQQMRSLISRLSWGLAGMTRPPFSGIAGRSNNLEAPGNVGLQGGGEVMLRLNCNFAQPTSRHYQNPPLSPPSYTDMSQWTSGLGEVRGTLSRQLKDQRRANRDAGVRLHLHEALKLLDRGD
jgi:hypothetical protein